MKRLLALGAVLAAVVSVLAVLPLSAGAHSDRRFVVGISGKLNESGTGGSGTFIAGGAVSTSGTFDAPFTATPLPNNCFAVTGDWAFTAPDGSFTFHGSGRSCTSSPSDPRPVVDFRFKITGGTGAYAGLAGRGSATGVVDFTDGTFTTIFDGTERGGH